jgi:hypothetical protein
MVKPERRYRLTWLPWPQSVCVKCARLGARGFICDRSCPQETVTIASLREYLAFARATEKLATPAPVRGTRSDAMYARWAKWRERHGRVRMSG